MTPQKVDLENLDWKMSREYFAELKDSLAKLEDTTETYDFTWVGKKHAIAEAGSPVDRTFRPDLANSKNWDSTENLFIEGDNLEALKLLQNSYLGKIKMIYIDPPYNTGKDFVYSDNFRQSTEEYDQATDRLDEDGLQNFKKNTREGGRFHSDWLSMMYPRLKLARNLLSEDGVIFISIDDNEQANLKKLCDEVFGEENFVATLHVELSLTQGMKVGAAQNGAIVKNGEFVHVYSNDAVSFKVNSVLYDGVQGYDNHFSIFLNENDDMMPMGDFIKNETKIHHYFDTYKLPKNFSSFCRLIEVSTEFKDEIYTNYADKLYQSMMASITLPADVSIELDSKSVVRYQKYILHKVDSGKVRQLLPLSATIGLSDDYSPQLGRRRIRGDMWKGFYSDMMNVAKEGGVDYKNGKKPTRLIKQLIRWGAEKDDYVVDFFAGSATTADAVMQLNAEDGGNRKWIMVQLPEETDEKSEAYKAGYKTIPEISRERIRRAGDKIASEHPDAKVDYGFRALKIDSLNEIGKVELGEIQQTELLNYVDNFHDDRNAYDLLYGYLIHAGMPLNGAFELKQAGEQDVMFYDYLGEGTGVVACLEMSVSDAAVQVIAEAQPLVAVFRDGAFQTSQEKINVVQKIKAISPETQVKVL